MNGYYAAIHNIILRKSDCDWQFLFCPLDLSCTCISESALYQDRFKWGQGQASQTRGPKKLAENAAQAGEAAGQQSKV